MNLNLCKDKNKKIHFIGIGGISMSALAEILLINGYNVTGSDMSHSPITDSLAVKGAKIFIGHNCDNITEADLIVYTAAISLDNPEFLKAQELNIPLISRAELLGELMRDHKYNLAVAGTHGKTTTTAMISHIAMKANLDPTILVGGELDLINGNVRTGCSEYFITEACEYKASFLKFRPYIAIILNVDADHLDFYRNIYHIQDTFQQFANLVPSNGYLIGYQEDAKLKEILNKAKCNTLSFGLNEGDVHTHNITYNKNGYPSFDVIKFGQKLFNISLSVPGKHNILNALAAITSTLILDVSYSAIVEGLLEFKGVHKRFEIKGTKGGVTVIDDYAHHPTEIKATLSTAKSYSHQRIVCVFQPHTYSRTISLFDSFASAFSDVDELILADIYAAREKDTGEINSETLAQKIRGNGVSCRNIHNFVDIVSYLKSSLRDGDLLLTVGAGDIVKVGELFLSRD